MSIKKPELLAPAGNREKLETAILYGADAVYLAGKRFGMRANAGNFSDEELADAVIYCHSQKVKIYVTVNIQAHNKDLDGIVDYLRFLHKIKIDAVIISDLGIYKLCLENVPQLPVHVSTQFSASNYETCRFLAGLGAERIVLPRELSLAEIKEIQSKTPVELEIFVHGAMCMAYSGRCMISYHTTGRDANRGECAQPCRYPYKLSSEMLADEIEVEADENGTFFFNSRDLCLIEHIPALVDSAIASFKIEGRMKTAAYLAGVLKIYRQAIDLYCENPATYQFDPQWQNDLQKVSNRGYTTFKLFDEKGDNSQNFFSSKATAEGEIVGIIKEVIDKQVMVVEVKAAFTPDQELEIVIPGKKNLTVRWHEIKNVLGKLITRTNPNQIVIVKHYKTVVPGAIIRSLKTDNT